MEDLRRCKALKFTFLLIGIFVLTSVSQAQQEDTKLELKTTAQKEIKIKKDGKVEIKMIPLDKVNPGDIVVYTITYRTAGKGAVVDAVIIDPIPRGVVCLPDTAEGKDAEIMYSIDNSHSWQRPPITMQSKKPDGTIEYKTVPADRYTHIKWVIKKPVLPGQAGQVSFKVTVK